MTTSSAVATAATAAAAASVDVAGDCRQSRLPGGYHVTVAVLICLFVSILFFYFNSFLLFFTEQPRQAGRQSDRQTEGQTDGQAGRQFSFDYAGAYFAPHHRHHLIAIVIISISISFSMRLTHATERQTDCKQTSAESSAVVVAASVVAAVDIVAIISSCCDCAVSGTFRQQPVKLPHWSLAQRDVAGCTSAKGAAGKITADVKKTWQQLNSFLKLTYNIFKF